MGDGASENSQLSSSVVESSDDASKKRAEEEKAARMKKKGLTKEDLESIVDIELSETKTRTLLHIPGTYVKPETESAAENLERNTAYTDLKKAKIGSDLYSMRGTQTLNANKKEKSQLFVGYTTAAAEANSSNWEIADARN